ncbi:unnamed protein product [Didymodactylos carnosus]|uniref:Uncharacterized protein n=1 Tax=Didymodactylos carnosus TaxID=1234261 RepID=A0A814X6F4_9BILA|nr:unnamed protein product [Didymodactylos carnosus]CAF1215015.1 unnamed protein product [Didymodactylos carnosus]CAF3796916.1 unnamed protein product [Didymodactylos carnosus]CAF3978877.1 unnamed protein product [Didymodactylos carnosus]
MPSVGHFFLNILQARDLRYIVDKKKSKDLQNVVLYKHQSGDHPRKIFRDLNGALSLDTIQRWIKMIEQTGSINLSKPPGRQRTARTKATIRKVKQRVARGCWKESWRVNSTYQTQVSIES